MGRGRRLVVALGWCAVAAALVPPAPSARAPLPPAAALKRPPRARNDRPKGAGRQRQGKKRADLMRGLIDPPAPTTTAAAALAADDPLLPFIKGLAAAADGKKAADTKAFHVAPLTELCSFVVVANGRSKPQTDAIAAAVADAARDDFEREPSHVEGGSAGGWTCLDFGDVIVNVMSPAAREFYDIDALWAKATAVDLSDVLTPETGFLDDDDLVSDYDLDAALEWDAAPPGGDLPTW